MTKQNRTRSQFLEHITVHKLCPKGHLKPGQFEWNITVMTKECILLFVALPP